MSQEKTTETRPQAETHAAKRDLYEESQIDIGPVARARVTLIELTSILEARKVPIRVVDRKNEAEEAPRKAQSTYTDHVEIARIAISGRYRGDEAQALRATTNAFAAVGLALMDDQYQCGLAECLPSFNGKDGEDEGRTIARIAEQYAVDLLVESRPPTALVLEIGRLRGQDRQVQQLYERDDETEPTRRQVENAAHQLEAQLQAEREAAQRRLGTPETGLTI